MTKNVKKCLLSRLYLLRMSWASQGVVIMSLELQCMWDAGIMPLLIPWHHVMYWSMHELCKSDESDDIFVAVVLSNRLTSHLTIRVETKWQTCSVYTLQCYSFVLSPGWRHESWSNSMYFLYALFVWSHCTRMNIMESLTIY